MHFKSFYKSFAATFSLIIAITLCFLLYVESTIPDHINVVRGEEPYLPSAYPLTVTKMDIETIPASASILANESYNADVRLLGSLSIKTVQVNVVDRKRVVVGGNPFGIKMFTEGVMVVGISDIPVGNTTQNPAKQSGIQTGDIILEINDEIIDSNHKLGEMVANSMGETLTFKLRRHGENMDIFLTPVKSAADSKYRAGIWVRDSSAGIGTMTFYDPSNGVFSGLGHAICDIDTGELMPLDRGEVVDVDITGVHRGEAGAPGELQGTLMNQTILGQLDDNRESGIYGHINNEDYFTGARLELPLATRSEIAIGPAKIRTTIAGNTPEEFDIYIEKILLNDTTLTKNMVIKVTDPELIEKSGGIVQGMSGSPIIQNGMLVGSVTHVFVNDPLRGFGIFAENIYSDNLQKEWKKAS